MNIQDWFPLGLTGLISLLSKGLSRVFSSTTVQKHQFFSAQLSLWSNSHIHTWLLGKPWLWLSSVKFSSVAQLCPTLCDPMDCSTPGFPVHHQLQELAQTHVHRVGNPIPFPSCFQSAVGEWSLLHWNRRWFCLSQQQGLFKWVSSLHQVAKLLEFQLQYQSLQWIFRTDFL